MNDAFEPKVRAAAAAGWWTLLVAAVFLLIQWFAYLLVMSSRPAWLLMFWGHGASWETVGNVWFRAIAVCKLSLWLLALGVLWSTLWAARLRKLASGR